MVFRDFSHQELLRDVSNPVASFTELYRRHVQAVLGYVASRGLDADTAADIVSETFIVALRKREACQLDTPSARPWLLGIAAREIASARRAARYDAQRVARLVHERPPLSTADRESYALQQARGIDPDELLNDLPAGQRQAVWARVIAEEDYSTIAQRLGHTEQATRQSVSRGLRRLRNQLGRAQ